MAFNSLTNQVKNGFNNQSISGFARWLDGLALVFILAFFLSGVLTLPRYGLTWDEGLGNVFFGERYVLYLTSFQEKFLDFHNNLYATSDLPLDLFVSPYHEQPFVYPPLADTVSAASMYLLSYNLHWMDPVDAFHLPKVVLSAIFLGVFYRFFARRAGRPVAFMGLLFLGTFPRFWGDMHFNPKDVPETIFFGLTVMSYVVWYEKPQWSKALLTGVLFAAALAVKMNAVFIPFVCVLGVWQWDLRHPRSWLAHLLHLRDHFVHYLLMGASTLLAYYLSWPYIYKAPLWALTYFKLMASQEGRLGGVNWNGQPFLQVLTTMPEVMLVCFLLGLGLVCVQIWKKPAPVWRLALVWALLPVVRISLPGMVNFDGIRHFLEFLPGAAALAGMGAVQLALWLGKKQPRLQLAAGMLVVVLLAGNVADILVRYFPYEYVYYNRFVGGLQGARQVFGKDESTDYWAVSYREGLDWINRHAGPGASLNVPLAGYLVDETHRIWLRPDIQLLPEKTDLTQMAAKEVYVMFILRPVFYHSISTDLIQNQQPVYQVRVDGVAVMAIYRYAAP
jgi:hypothetical protein